MSLLDIYGIARNEDTILQPHAHKGKDSRVEGDCIIFIDELVQKAADVLVPVIDDHEKQNLQGSTFVYGLHHLTKHVKVVYGRFTLT